jgi:hypothetical protein
MPIASAQVTVKGKINASSEALTDDSGSQTSFQSRSQALIRK